MRVAETTAATAMVPIHPRKILAKSFQLTDSAPPTSPIPTAAPILHCVVEMGSPTQEATMTTKEAASSMKKPLQGVTGTRFTPTVAMTLYPMVARPMMIPRAPKARIHAGEGEVSPTFPDW